MVRLTTGEKAGQVVVLDADAAQDLLDSGKAVDVEAPFVAMESADSPQEALRDTNSTGPVEFAAMPSVNADGSVTGVAVEEPEDTEGKPAKPKKSRKQNHGSKVSAAARDKDGDGELSHGERVRAAAHSKPETPETSADVKRGERTADDDEEVKEERTDQALAAERDAR